jgi:surface antigen
VAYRVDLPVNSKLDFNPWSCISYAKAQRGIKESWGYPNRVEVYDIEPSPGLIVFTSEGPLGHVAYVESVSASSIFVSEANYKPGLVTRREIPRDAPIIRGYR